MKLHTPFFLCLICTLSLGACAQSSSPEQPQPIKQKAVIIKPEQAANIPIDPMAVTTQDPGPMIDLDNPPRSPAIPAAELKMQILRLIDSLQSKDNMSREHVEKILGISLMQHPRAHDMLIYFGQVTEGWAYNTVLTYTYGDPIPSIGIGLIKNEEVVAEDALPKNCTLGFEELEKGLVELGYKPGSDEGTAAFVYGNKHAGFSKEFPENKIGFGVGLYVYRAENGTEDGRFCVKSIDIGHEMKP